MHVFGSMVVVVHCLFGSQDYWLLKLFFLNFGQREVVIDILWLLGAVSMLLCVLPGFPLGFCIQRLSPWVVTLVHVVDHRVSLVPRNCREGILLLLLETWLKRILVVFWRLWRCDTHDIGQYRSCGTLFCCRKVLYMLHSSMGLHVCLWLMVVRWLSWRLLVVCRRYKLHSRWVKKGGVARVLTLGYVFRSGHMRLCVPPDHIPGDLSLALFYMGRIGRSGSGLSRSF